MTNSVLRSIVDRILRLKEEQDSLTGDIKDVYAEAVSHGYNKARLGEVITILRKRAKDPNAFDERNTIVQLYLDELEETGTRYSAPRAHTRAREAKNTSGESRERQTDGKPEMAQASSKPEAPPKGVIPERVPPGTAATDWQCEDIPDYLRRVQ